MLLYEIIPSLATLKPAVRHTIPALRSKALFLRNKIFSFPAPENIGDTAQSLVRKMRSQIFSSNCIEISQAGCLSVSPSVTSWHLPHKGEITCQEISVQDDGKYASRLRAKLLGVLCAVLPIVVSYCSHYITLSGIIKGEYPFTEGYLQKIMSFPFLQASRVSFRRKPFALWECQRAFWRR